MKKLALLIVLATSLGLSVHVASATPLCIGTGTTLDAYIALGSGGCELNGLLFSNFSYSYSVTNATNPNRGRDVPATAVNVNILANTDWQFGGNWSTTGDQTSSLSLTFDVQSITNNVTTLKSVFTDAVTAPGTLTVDAACNGGTCGPTDFTNNTVNITTTPGPLSISNTATEASNTTAGSGGLVHLSIIEDQFAASAPPGVPEPVTTALIGGGLALLAAVKKFRK